MYPESCRCNGAFCTDIYCTVPVLATAVCLKMNPRSKKHVQVEDTVGGKKINIKFDRDEFCRFTLCDYITTTRCVTTQKSAVLSDTLCTTNLRFDATHRGEKPTNNHLSHDTALKGSYTLIISP
jgi:hypothetical protein